jgi:L-cysteine:1D-myo-inositol 2-amino-2-deoxy-alpha-D-glucopyranoside ligase
MFPHHEMCAAQAQVLSGKPLANTYVHAGMIGLDGEKMSKSKGNLVFVSTLVASGTDPMAIRWALMKNHYRTDRMWTEELLRESESEILVLRSVLSQEFVAPTKNLIQKIVDHLADDLDTPQIIASVNTWVQQSQSGVSGGEVEPLLTVLDSLLGLKL